jgi:cation-transporting ATPase E
MIALADCDCEKIMRNICGASKDENATMTALKEHFVPLRDFTVVSEIPFSSERKYSGIYFRDQGAYILGAADFVLPAGHEEVKERAEQMVENGARVLLLARSDTHPGGNSLPPALEPLALIALADELRPDVHDTLSYFYKYDVDIKIISGDHPVAVSRIAEKAGVRNAADYVDASTLITPEQLAEAVENYSVFGRVSPAQKKQMVALMKKNGHKVAMMGDGVNDTLALKEADCSVAVASGSDAAKNVSDIVLMDSSLKHLLHVVEDGRKIINNIQRVATLFITKTVYSVLLALATLFLFDSAYPFTPLQLVITSFTTIGAPAFFLALEPQYGRIKSKFIRNVLERSLPGGLAIMLAIVFANVLTSSLGFTAQELSTMCVYIVVAGGMIVLFKVSRPLTKIRKAVIIGMSGLFILGCVFFRNFFEIYALSAGAIIATVALCVVMPLTMLLFEFLTRKMWDVFDTRKPKIRQLEKITEAINKGINKE